MAVVFVERDFFQLAAALLPALLFGGVVLLKAPPEDRPLKGWERVYGSLLPMGATIAIVAEAFAITGALSSEPTSLQRWVTIGAIAMGLWSITIAATFPWIDRVHSEDQARLFRRAVVVGTTLIILLCGSLMNNVISGEETLASQKATLEKTKREGRQMLAKQRRDNHLLQAITRQTLKVSDLNDELLAAASEGVHSPAFITAKARVRFEQSRLDSMVDRLTALDKTLYAGD